MGGTSKNPVLVRGRDFTSYLFTLHFYCSKIYQNIKNMLNNCYGNRKKEMLTAEMFSPSAVRAIREAAELCGIEKLMWGSDYPRTMVEITYKMSFDFVLKSKELTEAEKSAFLFENARSFYGFTDLTECDKIKNMLEE